MQVNGPKRKGKSPLGPYFWHFVVLGLLWLTTLAAALVVSPGR